MSKMIYPDSDISDRFPDCFDHMALIMKSFNQRAMFSHTIEKYNKDEGSRLKDRILFIFGEIDIFGRKEKLEICQSDGFSYKIIEKAGHAINFEQQEKINKEIILYLKKGHME